MFKKIVCASLLSFSLTSMNAWAGVSQGTYRGSNPGVVSATLEITGDGPGRLLKGYLSYEGGYQLPFKSFIADTTGERIESSGSVTATYEYGYTCAYPFKAYLYPTESGFKLWVNQPLVWDRWFSGIDCQTTGTWQDAGEFVAVP